jgi:hypothetical protein
VAPTKMQTLILWALLVSPRSAGLQKDIRPKVSKSDREALVEGGLIDSAKRGRAFWLEVTDKGWAWAQDHLDADLPSRSTEGAPILKALLGRLKPFMEARRFGLADILGPQTKLEPPLDGYAAVRERVRQAYLDVTGDRFNTRALLSDLRAKLKDIDHAALDDALRRMHLEDDVNLSGIDNPREITHDIREAAIDFKGLQMLELWITK